MYLTHVKVNVVIWFIFVIHHINSISGIKFHSVTGEPALLTVK